MGDSVLSDKRESARFGSIVFLLRIVAEVGSLYEESEREEKWLRFDILLPGDGHRRIDYDSHQSVIECHVWSSGALGHSLFFCMCDDFPLNSQSRTNLSSSPYQLNNYRSTSITKSYNTTVPYLSASSASHSRAASSSTQLPTGHI